MASNDQDKNTSGGKVPPVNDPYKDDRKHQDKDRKGNR